jgi:membrane protein YqaA with SNARE-associated domain
MRSLFSSLLGYFLSPAGVVVLALLDSSLVFFLPLGIDFVVIILSARNPELFWLYALLAAVGALAGGRNIGEHGLTRLITPSRLKRVRRRVSNSAAVSVGALALIPPPFPFTGFVLTSGALGVDPYRFFSTLALFRLVRFIVEAGLAARYGRRILAWMKSPTFEVVVGALIVLAVAGTLVSAVAVIRATRRR